MKSGSSPACGFKTWQQRALAAEAELKQLKGSLKESVSVPMEVWDKLVKLTKRCRDVRENPQNWPLTPQRMADEIQALHYLIREIDESEPYLRTCLLEAAGKYVEFLKAKK